MLLYPKILFLVLFCACILCVQAQNKTAAVSTNTGNNYSKTASGLEYQIIKEGIGKKTPELGGYINFWFQLRTLNDSIFENQFADPNPLNLPTPLPIHKSSIEEGLLLLTEGDSAVFLLQADSLYINTFQQPVPAYLKPQTTIKMIVKMGKVFSKQYVDSVSAPRKQVKEVTKLSPEEEIFKRDSLLIQVYLSSRNLKGVATKSGAYVAILKPSTEPGDFIQRNESIKTTYIGKLLIDGTEFDRSPKDDYFSFVVAQGQVIRGWDEGFQKLKHGEKALILIPSRLGYGASGAGASIPPNAPLVFEVEVK